MAGNSNGMKSNNMNYENVNLSSNSKALWLNLRTCGWKWQKGRQT